MARDRSQTIHIFLLTILSLTFVWSVIRPEEGFLVWAIEVVPSVIIITFVLFTYNKFRLSTLSYFIITVLCILTFIGGHYSYSKVPIFDWLKDYFDLQRNHYDRFGHFLKGLMVIVIREILLRKTPLIKNKVTTFIALCITLSFGAIYEIIEWVSTKFGGGKRVTKDFLGMQGDKWDAQWDMCLLLLGSILATLILAKHLDKFLERDIE